MKPKYQRVLLKLSGEYLGGEGGRGFDFATVTSLTRQICEIHDLGVQIGIVLGGGNFFRGASSVPIKMDRVAGDQIGMLATVMNSLCLRESLIDQGKKAQIMTGLAVPQVGEPFNKKKAVALMEQGDILICAGGTGNPYFSTDTAAVLRGLEIDADVVIKGTKVDGVYDKDPMRFKDAQKYDELSYTTILEKDLKVMDAPAIAMCRDNNLPLSILSISQPTDLLDFINGKKVGTLVSQ
ncbi:MAG: UMP kinase [SAR324 cluster bacterium]|uniref:Uridylate kinase n=1 Tax=SAR324 cluster bacterium TaxID=2024889 RepID=A0A2A4SNH7_9DELT|nr:MAG: UMP kinase [SAR324 cluster bacterium]